MPGLVLFGRRWAVASDDLVYPGLCLAILHAIWIIFTITILTKYQPTSDNQCFNFLWKHGMIYLLMIIVCFIFEVIITIISSRGTIMDPRPREPLRYFLYIRLTLLGVEIAWMIVGGVWVNETYQLCLSDWITIVFIGIFFCSWLGIIFVIILGWCTFDRGGKVRSSRDIDDSFIRSLDRKRWKRRCKYMCCCLGLDEHNQQTMFEIAELFSDFFLETDLVMSDILAGLIILRHFYRAEKLMLMRNRNSGITEFLSGTSIFSWSQFFNLDEPRNVNELKDMIHYMKYCMASYGWPIYYYINLKTCQCKQLLCCMGCCFFCHLRNQPNVLGDNCCMCHYSALKKLTEFTDCEIIYVKYSVNFGQPAFLVAIDHTKKDIVVCIRGTMSRKDALTDLVAGSAPIQCNGSSPHWLAHKGILKAAEYVQSELKEKRLIEAARSTKLNQKECSTYRLVIVGHSLGAGTAAILSVLLHNDYPNLKCFAYSPPGGLMSIEAAKYSKKFTTSIVVGLDIIPRLGIQQITNFRSDVESALLHSRLPKWRVMMQCLPCCDMLLEESCVTSFRNSRHNCRSNSSMKFFAETGPLYPPGRILHIVRQFDDPHIIYPRRRLNYKYKGVWIGNKDLDEITITSYTMRDHVPDVVLGALESLLIHERSYSRGSYRSLPFD